jgi:preprotein translocase subunit YajC
VPQIIILIVMFVLLWAVLIRPQKAKQQRQQQLLNSVEPGDEILTVGGIFGIVQGVDEDDELIVEIAEGVHVRMARKAIATVVKPDTEDEVDEAEAIEERQEEMAREVEAARVGDPVS